MTGQLPLFEEQPVRAATLRIVNTGDGLSDAFKISPHALAVGTEVFFVLRGTVSAVNHAEKGAGLTRVHTVRAEDVTEVDREDVEKLLTDAADRLERARAASLGQGAIDDDDEYDDDGGGES